MIAPLQKGQPTLNIKINAWRLICQQQNMELLILVAYITVSAAVVIVPLQHIETRRIRLIREGKWEQHQRMKEALRMKKIKSNDSLHRSIGSQGVSSILSLMKWVVCAFVYVRLMLPPRDLQKSLGSVQYQTAI